MGGGEGRGWRAGEVQGEGEGEGEGERARARLKGADEGLDVAPHHTHTCWYAARAAIQTA